VLRQIGFELRQHAPFTIVGAVTGMAIMAAMVTAQVPRSYSHGLFWGLHPLHVLFSAIATASMFRLKSGGGLWATLAVGYAGSVGIATLSDSLIPFVGEWMLNMPHREVHLGFIEKWWLINPLAVLGIAAGCARPRTELPHAAHVLLSTWASLFHMTLAMEGGLTLSTGASIGLFLFLAVWVPCCASDIAFPLLFGSGRRWIALGRAISRQG
jgi:hypothetical protein